MTTRLDLADVIGMRAWARHRALHGHVLELTVIHAGGRRSELSLATDDPLLGHAYFEASRVINAAMADAAKARETAKIEERAAERLDRHVADCFAAQRTKRNELTAEECTKRAAAAQAFPFLHPGPTLSGAQSPHSAGLAPSPSSPGAAGLPYPNCHMPGACTVRGYCLKDPNCAG